MKTQTTSFESFLRAAETAVSPHTHLGRLGRWFPEPVGRWFAGRYLRPDRTQATRVEEIAFRDGLERVDVGDDLWAAEAGAGPVVLFIHGWGYRGTRLQPLVERTVAAGYRAVLLDLPAHGQSKGRKLVPSEATDAVLRVARVVGPLRAVVGHSFGGAVATMALARGLPATRIAMIGSPTSYGPSFLNVMDRLGLVGPVQDVARRELAKRVGLLEAIDVTAAAATVGDRPMLLVHDPEDAEVPFADALRNARVWPNSELVRVEGAGHTKILEHPEAQDAVLRFLAD